jgi:hypothetical protein
MTATNQPRPASTLWTIADDLRGLRNGGSFQDHRLSLLVPYPDSTSCEAAAKRGLIQQIFPTVEEVVA